MSPGAYYLLWNKHGRDQLRVPREPRQLLVCSVTPWGSRGAFSLGCTFLKPLSMWISTEHAEKLLGCLPLCSLCQCSNSSLWCLLHVPQRGLWLSFQITDLFMRSKCLAQPRRQDDSRLSSAPALGPSRRGISLHWNPVTFILPQTLSGSKPLSFLHPRA